MAIPTGLEEIDHMLHGGLKVGIVDIYGAPATGKTQLALQVTRNCIAGGGRVIFQDTSGKFRPERLLQMLEAGSFDRVLLESVSVYRATNSLEQREALDRIDASRCSLLVIDDISELFSFEYSRMHQAAKKNRLFVRYMAKLSALSLDCRLPVLTVNSIRSVDSTERENMSRAMDMFTHVKIHLAAEADTGRPTSSHGIIRHCTVTLPRAEIRFPFTITTAGLVRSAAEPDRRTSQLP